MRLSRCSGLISIRATNLDCLGRSTISSFILSPTSGIQSDCNIQESGQSTEQCAEFGGMTDGGVLVDEPDAILRL